MRRGVNTLPSSLSSQRLILRLCPSDNGMNEEGDSGYEEIDRMQRYPLLQQDVETRFLAPFAETGGVAERRKKREKSKFQ